ncbi:conserved membrane hypothetical protein [[Clostridium] ultunense Esp]|uniref:hypothetical protein n=1 Tax=Thermicanus aegyptius TaxID=94009 RepID=UPI0002B70308|nr:hypothetical protein [Thermicanus aegyptius]CCQ97745.1 conserved membrane hypothetical protein [[Clostridium] ultunense Esp]
MGIDVTQLLDQLRYPSGTDFFPIVTQILMVVTWAIHMFFVNLVIGGMILSIYGYLKKELRWRRASQTLANVAKISLSLAIVFGVAPLLFTQTIYDNLWYTANNLSAFWVVLFVPVAIVAYYLLYFYYFRNKERSGKWVLFLGIPSVLLILLAGAIMHILSYQQLFPDQWVKWYTNNGTTMNTDGWHVYAFNIPRYLLFILLSFFVTGIYMMLYAWYFRQRQDKDQGELAWFKEVGRKAALFFGGFLILDVILYNALQGSLLNPIIWVIVAFLLLSWFLLMLLGKSPHDGAVPTLITFAFLSVLAVGVMREAIRMFELRKFQYSVYNYPLRLDLFGPSFFFATLLVGIAVFVFVLYMLYQAGKKEGHYDAHQNQTIVSLWKFSFYALVMWLIVFWGTGAIVVANINHF